MTRTSKDKVSQLKQPEDDSQTNALTQNTLVLFLSKCIKDVLIFVDFSDTLIARQKKQSYRTSRQEVSSKEETLEEKIARVRREMEEIRMQMVDEKRDQIEVGEWEALMQNLSSENDAAKALTSRLQKVSSSTSAPSATTVLPVR